MAQIQGPCNTPPDLPNISIGDGFKRTEPYHQPYIAFHPVGANPCGCPVYSRPILFGAPTRGAPTAASAPKVVLAIIFYFRITNISIGDGFKRTEPYHQPYIAFHPVGANPCGCPVYSRPILFGAPTRGAPTAVLAIIFILMPGQRVVLNIF